MRDKKYLTDKIKFVNRSKNFDTLCIVLAGYKEFLNSAVMGRLKKYIPEKIDVCIITSGKWSDSISLLCEENKWSYLSTERNNVSLAQNIAINIHKNAEYIFKLDEDIFITKGYFEKMINSYKKCRDNSLYNAGCLAPIIPINGFGHVKVIEKYKMEYIYKKIYGDLKIASGPERPIESNAKLAMFMWGEPIEVEGETYHLPGIDKMNEDFSKDEEKLYGCPIRFSIGAILFERKIWKDMGYFHVGKGNAMGADEVQLCEYCMIQSRPIVITNNTVVGHLSFGKQNEDMKNYYLSHTSIFMPNNE